VTLILDLVKVISACTTHGTSIIQDSRVKCCNIDIPSSFKSCDSFSRRKFKKGLQQANRLGPNLSLSTISFELQAKMVEEIDLEKCNFRQSRSPVTLTFDWVEATLVRISGRGLPTHQIRSKSEKNVDVRMDVRTEFSRSISTSLGDDPKNTVMR